MTFMTMWMVVAFTDTHTAGLEHYRLKLNYFQLLPFVRGFIAPVQQVIAFCVECCGLVVQLFDLLYIFVVDLL